MRARHIFELDDPVSEDRLAVDLDGDRVVFRQRINGADVVLVLAEPGAGLRLGRALVEALGDDGGESA